VKIAYVGDFINYGTSLQTSGTSLVILLSGMENVTSIDVYCPKVNRIMEEFKIPKKVKVIDFFLYDNSISIARLLMIKWKVYDLVIFNLLPTGFGKRSIPNAMALVTPLLLTKLFRINDIKIIYHNSVFTNDVKNLGYNSPYNKIRSHLLGILEKIIFKKVPTYVLLNIYKERIDNVIGKNLVRVLDASYLEAITTVYMNNLIDKVLIKTEKSKVPTILLHGFWGPQKNIEMALSSLFKLKDDGIKFRLIISGGVNLHFPDYEAKFKKILDSYSNIIDEYIGYVKEKDIMSIFLKADLLILPYNTPGGHSGVIEQGKFFEVPTLAFDFPEYKEQANGNPIVKLIKPEELYITLASVLNSNQRPNIIKIENKIILTSHNVESILNTTGGGKIN
jgi:glycosyltransferase involved in cell wall biosynthesis